MVVVAAIDSSEKAPKVVAQADNLAEKFGDEIRAAHVMKKSEVIESKESDIASAESPEREDLQAIARDIGQKMLDSCSTRAEMEVVGLVGNPADEIVKYAIEQDSRYIVVSPKKKSQTGKILFGSVAQSIILNADCPVVSFTDV